MKLEVDILKEIKNKILIKPLTDIEAHRVVEDQNTSSTRKLVDSISEHETLEIMLEHSKPSIPQDENFNGLHYLLFTPFRYPPLQYGSRFGSYFERSLWYGSLEIETALAEVAFYRFLWLSGTSEKKLNNIEIKLTSFIAEISTKLGVDLTQSPFIKFRENISSPEHYQYSRPLGKHLRENNVEAFLYYSARRKGDFMNLGVFCPRAFKNKKPKKNSEKIWNCLTTHNTVEFTLNTFQEKKNLCYYRDDFLIYNQFPNPNQ